MATVPNIRALTTNQTGSLTAQSTNFNANPNGTTTAGSLGILQFWNSISATVPIITSISGGGTWVKIDSSVNGTTASEVWYCANMTAVSSITVTPALSITGGWNFGEFTGVLDTSPLDSSAKANTASSSWSFTCGPTTTSTDPRHLVIECDAPQNGGKGGGGTTPSGFTNLQTGGSGSTHGYLNYRVRVATSNQTESATVSGSSASSSAVTSIIAVFRPVSTLIQQRQVVTAQSGSPITVTAPLANSRQILAVSWGQSGGTPSGAGAITQTGTSWTRIGIIQGTGGMAEIWYSAVCTGSEGTSLTLTNGGVSSVYSEWTGLATSGSLVDQSATANTANAAGTGPTTVTSATITPTTGNQLIICPLSGYINNKSGTWGTLTGGFFSLGNVTAGGPSINCAFKVIASAASSSTSSALNPTLSTNTSPSYIASFFQSGGSSAEESRLMLMGVGS